MLAKHDFFNDSSINRKHLIALFFLKCVSCFFYVWVFAVDTSKNLFNSDTQSIMHDASILYGSLSNNFSDYFKMLFGFYNEADSILLNQHYFSLMDKWNVVGNNEFLLNDNRAVTRVNAFIMLFSFGKYEVHALVMTFISFVGQWLLFKSFKQYFKNKELTLIIVLLFIPSFYFWTGAVLKEAIVVFLLGVFVYSFFKLFLQTNRNWKYLAVLFFSIVMFLFVKPYVLAIVLPALVIYAFLYKRTIRFKGMFYLVALSLIITSGILISKYVFKKDIVSVIVTRQNDFVSSGYGGVFFYKNEQYVRIDYGDLDKIKLVNEKDKLYTIKPHVNYMYWQYPNLKDTIYVRNNMDTVTAYPLINITVPSNSVLTNKRMNNSLSSVVKMIPLALLNTFGKPFFIGDRNKLETFASIENALLLLFFILAFFYSDFKNVKWNLVCCFISIVFMSFLLIGLTTTISGAIVRYKVPFLPFLWMIPLMFLREDIVKKLTFRIKK